MKRVRALRTAWPELLLVLVVVMIATANVAAHQCIGAGATDAPSCVALIAHIVTR